VEIPAVRYFVMGQNRWQTAREWPLPETEWQRFYLRSQGEANTAAGNGLLSREEPGIEPPDTYIYDPHNPVPTVGGPLIGALPGPGVVAGPLLQNEVEKRNDVLCYTSPELEQDLEVIGPLQLHLFAATSTADTDFTAKLIHVYPDGGAYNLAEGLIRASGRHNREERDEVVPGEIYEFVITLGHTSQRFRQGHRIRVDISSSNFPQFDRNMNTGHPIGEDACGVVARQQVYHQTRYASYIDLPVIPGRA
jgi:putative CocE/NonD family hydrolase